MKLDVLQDFSDQELAQVFSNPDLHASMYITALDLLYPDQIYMDFEPETLMLEYPALKHYSRTLDKVQAGIAIRTGYSFWEDYNVFEKITSALNDNHVSFDYQQLPSAAEMAWAVVEAGLIADIPLQDVDFGRDVKIYIAGIMHNEGYYSTPAALLKIEPLLIKLSRHKASPYTSEQEEVQRLKIIAIEEYIANNINNLHSCTKKKILE